MNARLACVGIVIAAALLPLRVSNAASVSPVELNFDIEAGTSKEASVFIRNDTRSTQTYTLSSMNFIPTGENGAQEFIREASSTGLASWIVLARPSISLNAGEQTKFPFLITVPSDAPPGGHYAALFFSNAPVRQAGNVGVIEKTGVLLLVRVSGEIHEEAAIESFRLTQGNSLARLPADFELRVSNRGSTHVRPSGEVTIRNVFGNTVTKLPFHPEDAAILPASTRRFESSWFKTSSPARSGYWGGVADEWNNFSLGRYSATVALGYGTQGQHLETSLVFWVIPWRLISTIIEGLIVILILIKLYNKQVLRVAMKKADGRARAAGRPGGQAGEGKGSQ
jgi:hypothetical protein